MPNHERAAARAINGSWPVMEAYFASPAWRSSGTDPAAIMRGMPWAEWSQEAGRVIDPLQKATAEAFGQEAASIGSLKGSFDFDTIDEVSIRYAQTQGSKLITAISESQRATVRAMVGESLQGDWTVDQLGRRLRDTVGLHPAWAQAVVRFEDRQYNVLIREGKTPAVAQATAARRAEAKRKRLLKRRGENIARTEIQTASNLGKFATWETAVGKGLAAKNSRKEYSPGPGACDICAPISGEVVGWDEPFSNGKMMPPFHPSCRCTANLLPPDYNDDELDPDTFDWLSPEDVLARPEFKPDLPGRIGSLVDRPAPFVAPALATAAPAPVAVASTADQLTLQSTAHLSDDELTELMIQYADTDPDAMDKILEIIDERAVRDDAMRAFDAAEEARIASEAAERSVWGTVPEEFKAGTGSLSRSPARGLSVDDQIREDYQAYVMTQHAKALNDINGNFFKPQYRGKGIDEFMLFEGSSTTALKYASEELIAWWEANGRHSLGSFRYGILGRREDYERHQRTLRLGFGGQMGAHNDRSTF